MFWDTPNKHSGPKTLRDRERCAMQIFNLLCVGYKLPADIVHREMLAIDDYRNATLTE